MFVCRTTEELNWRHLEVVKSKLLLKKRSAFNWVRLLGAPSSWAMKASENGGSTISCSLCKIIFPYVQLKFSRVAASDCCFSFFASASLRNCFGLLCKPSLLLVSWKLQGEFLSYPSLQDELTQLSDSHVLQTAALSWTSPMCLSCIGWPQLDVYPGAVFQVPQRGRNTLFDLLPVLLLA